MRKRPRAEVSAASPVGVPWLPPAELASLLAVVLVTLSDSTSTVPADTWRARIACEPSSTSPAARVKPVPAANPTTSPSASVAESARCVASSVRPPTTLSWSLPMTSATVWSLTRLSASAPAATRLPAAPAVALTVVPRSPVASTLTEPGSMTKVASWRSARTKCEERLSATDTPAPSEPRVAARASVVVCVTERASTTTAPVTVMSVSENGRSTIAAPEKSTTRFSAKAPATPAGAPTPERAVARASPSPVSPPPRVRTARLPAVMSTLATSASTVMKTRLSAAPIAMPAPRCAKLASASATSVGVPCASMSTAPVALMRPSSAWRS